MSLRINYGDYVVEMRSREDKLNGETIIRISSLFINRISIVQMGMLLSEWVTKDALSDVIRNQYPELKDDVRVVYSRQPRKRLRRFNIV